MLSTQHNAYLHALATVIVCVLGFVVGLSASDWRWIVLAVIVVWAAEAFNTAFEFLCDVVSPEFHPLVEKAKDAAAAAVLICALGTLIIGITVFGPYFIGIQGSEFRKSNKQT